MSDKHSLTELCDVLGCPTCSLIIANAHLQTEHTRLQAELGEVYAALDAVTKCQAQTRGQRIRDSFEQENARLREAVEFALTRITGCADSGPVSPEGTARACGVCVWCRLRDALAARPEGESVERCGDRNATGCGNPLPCPVHPERLESDDAD